MPHSDIRGSPGARPSPRLFAACHVLHRLSVPRHPPDALHVLRPRPAPSTRLRRVQSSDDRCQMSERSRPASTAEPAPSDLRSLPTSGTGAQTPPLPMLAHRHAYPCSRPDLTPKRMMAGPASRSRLASRFQKDRCQRTDAGRHPVRPGPSPRPSSNAIWPQRRHFDDHAGCQRAKDAAERRRPMPVAGALSSDIRHLTSGMVGLGRFERPTSRLSGVRSDQLSYRPPNFRPKPCPGRAMPPRPEHQAPRAGVF